jgi:glucosamine-6-phosphate deaminase
MRLIIRDDSDSASTYVANYIIERIRHFAPTPAHPFVLGLPTGSSPLGVYRILVEKYKAGEVISSDESPSKKSMADSTRSPSRML